MPTLTVYFILIVVGGGCTSQTSTSVSSLYTARKSPYSFYISQGAHEVGVCGASNCWIAQDVSKSGTTAIAIDGFHLLQCSGGAYYPFSTIAPSRISFYVRHSTTSAIYGGGFKLGKLKISSMLFVTLLFLLLQLIHRESLRYCACCIKASMKWI
jgi:hypothetical protein